MQHSEIYLTGDHEFRIKMLTKTQVKVILILLDNAGHAEWELTKSLSEKKAKSESNINPILKNLEKKGIIYQGAPRKSRNPEKRKGDYKEIPYFLTNGIDDLKLIITEIAKSNRLFDTGFILEIIENSKYIRTMKETFGEEINKNLKLVIRENYIPYSDPFFVNIIEPELNEELWKCCRIDAEDTLWKLECLALVYGMNKSY
jgi:hypothetical protein